MWERDGLQMVVERLQKEIAEQEAEWGWLFDEIDYRKRECKKLKEEKEFFYKSAKQFREQVEKWEKDFVEWRIVEKD
jgi:cell division protein FtsB